MSKKEWIGKVRIYLRYRNVYYQFCWISMERDASLLFGFTSKTIKFIEYGSSTVRSGYFTDHTQVITRGKMRIREANTPHITFHPPKIYQKSGIAHMVDEGGKVDEWELDWFPVKKAQSLLFAYTGGIDALDTVLKPKGRHQVVDVPHNSQYLRMEMTLYPNLNPQAPKIVHRSNAVANIHGLCVNYIVGCHFYPNAPTDPAVYVATDQYDKT